MDNKWVMVVIVVGVFLAAGLLSWRTGNIAREVEGSDSGLRLLFKPLIGSSAVSNAVIVVSVAVIVVSLVLARRSLGG